MRLMIRKMVLNGKYVSEIEVWAVGLTWFEIMPR